jgi:hypothetical protein
MLRALLKINEFVNSKTMKILDFAGAIGILLYAGYLYNQGSESYVYWAIGGGLGLLFAIVRPARFFTKKIETQVPQNK